MCVNFDDRLSYIVTHFRSLTFPFFPFSFLADFSNAVCSPPGTPKRSDPVGVIYWQVRPVIPQLPTVSSYLNPVPCFPQAPEMRT